MSDLIKPEDLKVKSLDGEEIHYIISRFPATVGREIITGYPTTAMPKMGDYKANEALMLKLMKHVAVVRDDQEIRLTTRALVDNHVPDFDVLARIEYATLNYNSNFFNIGKISKSLGLFEGKVEQSITKILTLFLERFLAKEKPQSKS